MGNDKARLHKLDILRALAALSVLFVHWTKYWDQKLLTGELKEIYGATVEFFSRMFFINHHVNAGVLLFIVLSGFVVHHTTSNDQVNLKSWRKFFIFKRLARVWPIYILSIIFASIVYLVLFPNVQFKGITPHLFFYMEFFRLASSL